MLTPMLVQYVVGLCCLRQDPDAVDVIIGDMVYDEAAEKERDVDVTITVADSEGGLTAFKAAEVKHEGSPLDVATVEQLIAKLADMPKITHKAIFSTSGYTEAACKKARKRSVDLYTLQPWERPISIDFPDFPGVGTPGEFLSQFESNLLYWTSSRCHYVLSEEAPLSILDPMVNVVDSQGRPHKKWVTLLDYQNEILFRSTGILCIHEPARTVLTSFPYTFNDRSSAYSVGPSWPHTHTMDLQRDHVCLISQGGKPILISSVSIIGFLQWRKRVVEPVFMILKNVLNQETFAGAAVADCGVGDGRMFAMIFPEKGRDIGIHRFEISEKQRNMIRKLSIKSGP
ncbi:hypothetical protein MMZ06_22475 [Burkholderia gladioli]|uniref:hypothetical protein n=1 Tax=Burkholderia gladioli TaxID=28095 RepID=UPI00163E8E68|nr:hypothetical protein [Burkholderia gladioli]MCH7272600.1 hypothetical protein [Burkholderia gladioli]MEB2548976.1 hypothetical protein [Burkholderia gladioli]